MKQRQPSPVIAIASTFVLGIVLVPQVAGTVSVKTDMDQSALTRIPPLPPPP